jgi:beta-glucanase (GH16 family)
VHDGVLDFFLHQVDGQPAGANPSPVITGSSQYQTYGRYDARFKVDSPDLSEYYVAWLLWPQSEGDWQCAESDYPEGGLDGTVGGFAHYGCSGDQDEIDGGGARYTDWHTYTQEWMPGERKYYVDNKVVATSTNQVYDKPQRWQLQTETNGDGNSSGHLTVDWVTVYSRQ